MCKENLGFILGLYTGSLGDLLSRILDKEVTIRFVSIVSIKEKSGQEEDGSKSSSQRQSAVGKGRKARTVLAPGPGGMWENHMTSGSKIERGFVSIGSD